MFSTVNRVNPLQTCITITTSCDSTASSLSEAVKQRAWMTNGGGNVSVRLIDEAQAEVTYTGEDGEDAPQSYRVNYTYTASSTGAPERIVIPSLVAPDAALTAAVSKSLSLGDGQLAFYVYNDTVIRGTYIPVQTGVKSKTFQYNKKAMNDIFSQWDPSVPSVVN